MQNFGVYYDAATDALEAFFPPYENELTRSISLNDQITILTDAGMTTIFGIEFEEVSVLLQVSETHLDGLRPLVEEDYQRILTLLKKHPASLFIDILDEEYYRAFVKVPTLLSLMDRG